MIPPTFLLAAAPNTDHQNGDGEKRGLLGWILPASIALHVAVVLVLPQTRAADLSLRAIPPSVIEMQEPPPPLPKPKPETIETRPTAPTTTAPPQRAAAPQPTEARPQQQQANLNAPLDFSSMSFSNDGPGLAIGVSAPPAPPPPATAAKPLPSATPSVAATTAPFVPLASLKKPPRAPGGLDAELERNYPIEARRSGISGTAILRVQLEPDGRVGRVDVVSESYSGFGNACTRTVRSARWEPPLDRDGHPVATEIKYVCRFEVGS